MSEKHLDAPVDGVTEDDGIRQGGIEQGSTEQGSTEHGSESGHPVVTRTVNAPPEFVWSVLADGWMYATWVVGASHIREVDPGWPAAGSRIHHSVGLWPALLDDNTEVLKSVATGPARELLLQARAWPAGDATVRLLVTAARADHSSVSIVEDVSHGPARLIPRAARQLLIVPRNKETLQRLAMIAEGRYRESVGNDTASTLGKRQAR